MKKSQVYTGKVIDNADPKKMARLKLRVDIIHDGCKDEDLPWATPLNGSSGKGSTDIPSIGEKVYVEFPDGDYHEPQYRGNVIDGKNLDPVFHTNYPHRKGFASESGAKFYRDESNGDVHFSAPTGISIDFKNDTIKIETSGSLTVKVGGMTCVIDGAGVTVTGGDVVADGISLKTHKQSGVVPGGGLSDVPV